MCEACAAECKDLGEVLPGLFLVQATTDFLHIKAGDFGLVRSNGPDVVWAAEPSPDPWEGLTEAEINDRPEGEFTEWDAKVDIFTEACRTQLYLTTAFDIGLICQAAGYNRQTDGSLDHWLFHRMGLLVQGSKTP